MALTKCADCGKEISDAAPSCPFCGRPKQAAMTGTEDVTTIERTGKRWKGLQLLCVAMIFAALFFAKINGSLSLVLGLTGILGLIVISLMAWWHHG